MCWLRSRCLLKDLLKRRPCKILQTTMGNLCFSRICFFVTLHILSIICLTFLQILSTLFDCLFDPLLPRTLNRKPIQHVSKMASKTRSENTTDKMSCFFRKYSPKGPKSIPTCFKNSPKIASGSTWRAMWNQGLGPKVRGLGRIVFLHIFLSRTNQQTNRQTYQQANQPTN